MKKHHLLLISKNKIEKTNFDTSLYNQKILSQNKNKDYSIQVRLEKEKPSTVIFYDIV